MSKEMILILGLAIAAIVFLIVFIITIIQARKDKSFKVIKSLSLLIPISASIFGVLAIILSTLYYYQSDNNIIDTQTTIFETFLTILSIAISVWVGLNIYNIVGKNELEDVQKESQSLTESMKKMQNESIDLKKDLIQIHEDLDNESKRLKELTNISINLLINVLINTRKDVMSEYFIQSFNSYLSTSNNDNTIDDVLLSNLICIETHFHNVHSSYESYEKDRIIFFANEGLKIISSVYSSYSSIGSSLVKSYLVFREGEFHFYLGMAQQGKNASNEFEISIQKYSEFSSLAEVTLPSVDYDIDLLNPDDIKLVFEDKITDNRTASYLCNTLGEAYNRILQNKYNKNISSYTSNEQLTIKEYYRKAFVYFCAAVSCNALALTDKETYSRNLGTFFEKFKQLLPGFDEYSSESIKQNSMQLEIFLNKALHCYKKSLECNAKKSKAHIAYASAILKHISIQMYIEDRKYDKEKQIVNDRSISLFSRKKRVKKTTQNNEIAEKQEMLKLALSHFEIAQKLDPKLLDSYYGIAKTYLYFALFEDDNQQALLYLNNGIQFVNEGKLIDKTSIPLQIFEKEILDLHTSIKSI